MKAKVFDDVDAIRFLYTFQNQLTKNQLLSVLPLLVWHLGSDNYVCYTYTAIAIDRIYSSSGGPSCYTHDIASALLDAVPNKIEEAGSLEEIAVNNNLMKCTMRTIITARQTLAPGYNHTPQSLVGILSFQ